MTKGATKDFEKLLAEVEALTSKYVGKDAESEMWGETCDRLERLDKLAKKIRKAQAAA
jgi:hypothetical protein